MVCSPSPRYRQDSSSLVEAGHSGSGTGNRLPVADALRLAVRYCGSRNRHDRCSLENVMRRNTWLLYVIAFPATIAIWGGWVSLEKLCGFGPVSLLPGIADVVIDTSIALPIGMEAYSAYALYVWLSSQGLGTGTRRYAKWSALGALVLEIGRAHV